MNTRTQAIIEMFELSELHRALGYEDMDECLEWETLELLENVLKEECCNFELEEFINE